MKNILAIVFSLSSLIQVTLAQTPIDSSDYFQVSEYPSFKDNYNANAAFVLDNRWTTTVGSQPLGRRWQAVADEFKVSPEGNDAYLLARRQIQRGMIFSWVGLGLTAGGLTLIGNATGSSIGTGVGVGTSLASLVFSMASIRNRFRAESNFEKALWLRNRDAMLNYLSPTDQPRFRYLYEAETIRLAHNNSYFKNEKKYRLGIFANNAVAEFQNIPDASVLFTEYQKYQRSGVLFQSLGIGAMVAAVPYGISTKQTSNFLLLYFGGVAGSVLGASLINNGRKRLRQAIHFRNYTVMERKMLRN
ncbi:hypothetical protein [Persicitalea sp.]|uniref:hypothetical protein n=1 Tax=Persicitalea sp. TaxID=3100273 RepID=UPI003593510F